MTKIGELLNAAKEMFHLKINVKSILVQLEPKAKKGSSKDARCWVGALV